MQLGMIGLGRMGGNMTTRLAQRRARGEDVRPRRRRRRPASLAELRDQLDAPRAFWMMVPAGDDHRGDVPGAARRSPSPATRSSTAATRTSATRSAGTPRRPSAASTSSTPASRAAIWGLEDGYCLMVGGDAEPCRGSSRSSRRSRPTDGYAHVGPSGAGHFTKMVHNGIEYGLMQAYAEGFEVLERSEFDLDLHEIAGIWRYGSVVRSWLLELLHAAFEPRAASSSRSRATSRTPARAAGRSPRRSPRTCPVPVITRRAVRAVRLAPGRVVRGEGERGAAQPVRRPRRALGRGRPKAPA